jgi:transposase, IS30 family
MAYKHLSVEEREIIQHGLWEKESVRAIAERIGRSHTSVLREINRNRPPLRRQYTPRMAEERAQKKRKSRGRTLRLKNAVVRQYVISHLKQRWSPEQIAGRIVKDGIGSISAEAIYQFVYAQIKNGYPIKNAEDLRPYLRRRRRRRIRKGARRGQRVERPRGRSIEERPKLVDHKRRFGDWEGDTVESCHHKPGINTLLERKSGLVQITKLLGKGSAETTAAVTKRFGTIPACLTRTLTLDNGSENSGWRAIESACNTQCFFAHVYRSCERGANENVNGLIRDYFPKKTDFTVIPEAALAYVEYALNTRPRKRLNWRTPLEVWSGALRG